MKPKCLLAGIILGFSMLMSGCYTTIMMGVTEAPIGNKIGKSKGLNTTLAKAKRKGNISQVGTWKTEFKWFLIFPLFEMEITGQ